jgi:hypothetical protein
VGLKACLLCLLLGGVVIPPAASTAIQPGLRVVKREPLVLRGTHFRARERVRVFYGSYLHRTTTNAIGTFSVTFTNDDRCTGGLVRAIGASGDRAALKLPQPLCPPP